MTKNLFFESYNCLPAGNTVKGWSLSYTVFLLSGGIIFMERSCKTHGCKNMAYKQRLYCNTCAKRKYRAKYPLKYAFDTIKSNAMRRGKAFTLTFIEFEEFCKKTGYDKMKGRNAECLSIDRKNPLLGYTKENIRAITVSDNVKCRFDPHYDPEMIPRFSEVPF